MYYSMLDHWTHSGPPVYMAVAGYLGLIKTRKSGQQGNLEDLENMFSGGFI